MLPSARAEVAISQPLTRVDTRNLRTIESASTLDADLALEAVGPYMRKQYDHCSDCYCEGEKQEELRPRRLGGSVQIFPAAFGVIVCGDDHSQDGPGEGDKKAEDEWHMKQRR